MNMKFNLRYFYDLVMVLTQKEIKVRYKNNFFGYLWSLANPLFFALIYYTVFKTIMRVKMEDYTLFLICGLFPWQWINNSIVNNLYAYLGNAQIIKKTNFPRSVLPLSNILMEGFNFLISLPVIFFFIKFYGLELHFGLYLVWIPILAIVQIMICYGFSLIFSTINLFFRDVERFVQLGFMMLFYITPILYNAKMIPEKYTWLLDYNPFARLMLCWKQLFMTGTVNHEYIWHSFWIGGVVMVIGFAIFNKLKYRFAEVL